jgi:hypothetical protein
MCRKCAHGKAADNSTDALDVEKYWNIHLGSPVLAYLKLWFEIGNPRRKIFFQKLLRKC